MPATADGETVTLHRPERATDRESHVAPHPEPHPGHDVEPHVVELGRVPDVLRRGALLTLETVLVPMTLLLLGLRLGGEHGTTVGLALVLTWRCGLPVLRLALGRRVPTMVWLATGLFLARAVPALVISSLAFYLWQPILIALLLGVFFCVSGLVGHPVTLRLAGDVVRLPASVRHDPAVRRVFSGMALIWGGVHVVCAGLGALVMQLPPESVVAVQGGLGVVCTVGSTGGCLVWGVWRLRRLPHLTLRFGAPVGVPVGGPADELFDVPGAAPGLAAGGSGVGLPAAA